MSPRSPTAALALVLASLLPGPASPHGQVPTEKQLLGAFKDAFGSADPAAREAAVTTLGESSRELPDKGAGKKVAQALVLGLEDADLAVSQAALFQIGRGRDVETVIGALEKALRLHRAELEKKISRRDVEARNYVVRGTVLFLNACRVLANYPDDRSAALLSGMLAKLPVESKEHDLAARLMSALAPSALELGTQAAFEAAIERLADYDLAAPEGAGRKLLDALTGAATRAGADPPPASEATPAAWQGWLDSHRERFPKKLGKLTTPPKSDPRVALDGLPGYGAY